jgi:hypothetical protein
MNSRCESQSLSMGWLRPAWPVPIPTSPHRTRSHAPHLQSHTAHSVPLARLSFALYDIIAHAHPSPTTAHARHAACSSDYSLEYAGLGNMDPPPTRHTTLCSSATTVIRAPIRKQLYTGG